MIFGGRVRQARELRGLTQAELAADISVTQSAVAQIEQGLIQPNADAAQRIAMCLMFPPSFFRAEPRDDFPVGSLLFRARRSLTAAERKRAHRFGEIIYELFDGLAARVRRPSVRLPDLSREDLCDPHYAAGMTRSALGLAPNVPIPNLLNAIERAGVIVLALPVERAKVDGYSAWTGRTLDQPIIAVFRGVPADRLRFSVAHELGHLVMHRACLDDYEQEADAFAAELLLPEDAMRQELHPPLTLTDLAQLKPRWGVSVQALVRRGRDLGLLSEHQYRSLFQQLTKRGWRVQEPPNLNSPPEQPRALRRMAELVYGEELDVRRFASDMRVTPAFAAEVLTDYAGRAPLVIPVVEGNVLAFRKPTLVPVEKRLEDPNDPEIRESCH